MTERSIVYNSAKAFSVEIYNIKKYLCHEKREYSIADQIMRSGTGIGANIAEALDAISRREFHAKMCIALKESSETRYWLEFLHDTHLISEQQFQPLHQQCRAINNMLTRICKTLQSEKS